MSHFQDDNVSEKTRYRDLVLRIWPFMKVHGLMLSILMIVVIVHTVIGRLLPFILGHVVDDVIMAKKTELLWKFCKLYLGLEIIRFILICTETYFFQVLGLRIIYEMRSKLFEHVQNLPVTFFDKNPIGRVVTRLTNDFGSLSELFTAGLISVFVDSLSLVAIVIAMLLINVKLTLIVLSITPLMLWSTFYLSGKARDSLRILKRKLASINSFNAENITGMKVTQLYAQEFRQRRKFKFLSNDYKNEQLTNVKYLALLHPVVNGFNAFTVTMALYYGGVLNNRSSIPVGLVVAFLMNVQDFLPPLRNILEKYQTFQASLASAERIFTLFDQPLDELDGQSLSAMRLPGRVEFKNVRFAYEQTHGEILKGLDFTIEPGQSVAIVGSTGSGKSTIISLLQRFYDFGPNDQGKILLDGIDLHKIRKQELRSRIGVVQQDFFLFRGTMLSNITLNDPRISEDIALRAALRAHCGRIIENRGLHGIVQEKGANLSTGEKQLINFARVLAFDPDILILDEATAHIDSQSEALIQNATREATKGRTSIIIAHRLSTIVECDRIMVLEKGHLVESGTHAELLKLGGAYRNLYDSQRRHVTV